MGIGGSELSTTNKINKYEKRIAELEALIDRAIRAASMYRDQPIFRTLEVDMRKAREE